MTYIEVIGVKITENVFQRHLIIIKTSYRHLEESFWLFIQFRFQNGHFVPCSISMVLPQEKLENYWNLQSYNQLFMRDSHFYKQLTVTL